MLTCDGEDGVGAQDPAGEAARATDRSTEPKEAKEGERMEACECDCDATIDASCVVDVARVGTERPTVASVATSVSFDAPAAPTPL